MGLFSIISKLIAYQEPEKKDYFELLSGDVHDIGKVDFGSTQPAAKKTKTSLKKRILNLITGKSGETQEEQIKGQTVSRKLQENKAILENEFNLPLNEGVITREFKILRSKEAFIIYLEGMVDQNTIENFILKQLLSIDEQIEPQMDLGLFLIENALATHDVLLVSHFPEIIKKVLNGYTGLFIAGYPQAILIETIFFERRSVSTPLREFVVEGPNEAFIEDLHTNITLVRKVLRNKNLISESIIVSSSNNTKCAILYLKDLANPQVVAEVRRRLKGINLDFVADGVIGQLIEDHPNAILPQVLNTERPDRAAGFLMQGRIAVIIEGTPAALIMPVTFFHFLYTAEDFYLRWQFGSFLRLVRLFAATLSLLLPGLYIALTLYHHEAIPTGLLLSLIKAREHLPFPVAVELLLMELSWELVREAGVRVPGVVGQTLGIVGGVILGEAAVAAGLVSPILIIIIAISGLANFTIPNFSIAFGFRILRFMFFFLGALAGFYGIAVGLCIFGGMALAMKSFGVPYFAPLAPSTKGPPILYAQPAWLEKERPDALDSLKRKKTQGVIRQWTKESRQGEDHEE